MIFRSSVIVIAAAYSFLCVNLLNAQTHEAPAGKSYSSEVKRPTSSAPQFPSPLTFSGITSQSGVAFRHQASPTNAKYLIETMGGGVGLIDYDNDGRMDIFFTNGAQLLDAMPKGQMPDKSNAKFWNRLYRQKPDGSYDDVTERAGVKGEGYGFGVAVGDYDKDGFADLFVTHYGGAVLYRNNGDGTFTDITKKAGISVSGWPASAGFMDYDNDGRLDLFITRYVIWDFERGSIFCGDKRPGFRSYCHPDNFQPSTSQLFHQKTDGTFEDVSEGAGITQTRGKALGVTFADFDDNGLTDIFVANDNTEQQLFCNKGDGKFEDIALMAGVALDENGKRFAGMGVDAADFDNDGRQDIAITAFSGETYPIYKNLGGNAFNYVTQQRGIAEITNLGTGWGIKFMDADSDGHRDLFVVQGHVSDLIEKTTDFLTYKQPALLIRNTGTTFQNISLAAGSFFKTPLSARGLAVGDLDNDGDDDVVISQTDGAAVILRNDGGKAGPKNHWIGISLRGVMSTSGGEGSRVVVTDSAGRKQVFDVSGAGSYLAANDPRIIAGLGPSAAVRSIYIRWPNGKTQVIENPAVDRYHKILEK